MVTAQYEVEHARSLVLHYGWNSTVHQILNPGMQLWFPEAGDAVIGFVTHAGIRVVAGAPVAAADRLVSVAEEFEWDASQAGESVCYFAVEARFEALWQARAVRARVALGAQPVWNPQDWRARTQQLAGHRAQLNRARNKGVAVNSWPVDYAQDHPELQARLADWLATRGLPPLHFLVEPATLADLTDKKVFVAESPEGIEGFVVACPVPAQNGWLIEQVVRRPGAPNGTAELMVDAAALALAGEGATYLTLGLSPLARLTGAAPNPLWLRLLLGWLRAHGRRFYHFQGLEYFKSKFDPPHWEPVYALLPGERVSPLALYAIAAAFSSGTPGLMVLRALGRAVATEAARLRW